MDEYTEKMIKGKKRAIIFDSALIAWNIGCTGLDTYLAIDSFADGNYGSGAIWAGAAVLMGLCAKLAHSFKKRNEKYLEEITAGATSEVKAGNELPLYSNPISDDMKKYTTKPRKY